MADLIPSPKPINAGPAHYLLASALRHLTRWVGEDVPPPVAPRIEIADDGSVVRDEHGNALGGIRTPQLDVPAATLSGDPVGDEIMFQLFGSTTTFDPAHLRDLYGDRDGYLAAFDQALDRAIAGGLGAARGPRRGGRRGPSRRILLRPGAQCHPTRWRRGLMPPWLRCCSSRRPPTRSTRIGFDRVRR